MSPFTGKPVCRCGKRFLTDLPTETLRLTWAAAEGIKWQKSATGSAYWILCQECHQREWPEDQRYANRWSRPGPSFAERLSANKGRVRLICGDFYLTETPLEHQQTHSSTAAAAAPSSPNARSRSPVRAVVPRVDSLRQQQQQATTGQPAASPEQGQVHKRAVWFWPFPPSSDRDTDYHMMQEITEFPDGIFEDRKPVDVGSYTCDSCGCDLADRKVYPLSVLRQAFPLSVPQCQQTDAAFLCMPCRSVLLKGNSMYLASLETFVRARIATWPTRAELMFALEAQGLAPCAAAIRARTQRRLQA